MASVPRSDKILAQLAARTGITPCGEEWLKEALDPFHDTLLTPVGYPDTTASASVIQVVKQSYQIASPLSSTTANWDCNITMLPWLNTIPFATTTSSASSNNLLVQPNPSALVSLGGVQIVSVASGAATGLNTPTVAGTASNTSNTIPSQYLQGNSRCVAMAIEVCNTTSDLNKQGLVTVYRIPVPQNDDGTSWAITNTVPSDTTSFNGSVSAVAVPTPPPNIAQAQLFAGTKAWAAELGTYQTAVFNTPDVPAQGINFTQPLIYTTSQTDTNVLFPLSVRVNGSSTTNPSGRAIVPNVYWTEFDMSGSYFTGLSAATTLTVDYIVYIERFPTQDDLDLIVSAKRSPEYDIRALEAYSVIAQSLPVAVPFNENGLGDWFKSAVNMAASILPSIPHPIAQGLGMAAKAAAGLYDSFDQPPSDTRAGIPDAPPMNNTRQTRQPNGATMRKARSKLKKTVTREAKFENRVRNELKGVGKIVRGVGAPKAPKMKRK